jgi:hypothetical protein
MIMPNTLWNTSWSRGLKASRTSSVKTMEMSWKQRHHDDDGDHRRQHERDDLLEALVKTHDGQLVT